MAFNFEIFKTRTLTAVVFVTVMLAGLLYNQWSFFALFSLIHFGCWIEFQRLIVLIYPDYKKTTPFHRNSIMLLGWCFMMICTNNSYHIQRIFLYGIGWYGMMVLTIIFCLNEIVIKKQFDIKAIGYSLLGLVYISMSWAMMMRLWDASFKLNDTFDTHGWLLPIVLISTIWINDTMAYMVGSFVGKTPLSSISPKKTWEGTIGGAILAITVVTVGSRYFFNISNIKLLLIVSATAAVAGVFGDLLESKLKRMAGVKDSGQLMPGHGGFLDRFDSLLIATPFVWLIVELLK